MRTKEQLIKELSIENLLDELCSANNRYVVGIEASPEYREVFSRLKQGEKVVESLKRAYGYTTAATDLLPEEINKLLKEVQNE
jgi:hypothetical protein